MKLISKIVLFWTFGLQVFCQSNGINPGTKSFYEGEEIIVTAGLGTYLMQDLKNLQTEFINSSDLGLQPTTSFPPYFYYAFRYGIPSDNAYEGLVAGFMSTGARSSLADYSGYIYSDINCLAFYAGYYFQKELYTIPFLKRNLSFGYNLNLSFIGSSILMIDKLNLYDHSSEDNDIIETNKLKFNALGIYSDPTLFARLMLGNNIGFELNAGGAVSLSTPVYYKSIKNYITISDKKRFVNWSGLRVSVGIVYKL